MINFNLIYVKEKLITSNALGTIRYKVNASPYQTVSWSDSQTLFYNKKLLFSDTNLYRKTLSSDEKREYKRLFHSLHNLNKTPEENVIKECIIVFTNGVIAIGLKITDGNIYTVFKSTKLNEINAICKKYNVKTDFDNKIAFDLFSDSYLNEIPPHYLIVSTAEKFVGVFKEDNIFKNKVYDSFTLSDNDTVEEE